MASSPPTFWETGCNFSQSWGRGVRSKLPLASTGLTLLDLWRSQWEVEWRMKNK
ncbi:MAG: hypothetical protein AAGH67_07400 [Cyanobacteria bacterium P01_H01_bin.162]